MFKPGPSGLRQKQPQLPRPAFRRLQVKSYLQDRVHHGYTMSEITEYILDTHRRSIGFAIECKVVLVIFVQFNPVCKRVGLPVRRINSNDNKYHTRIYTVCPMVPGVREWPCFRRQPAAHGISNALHDCRNGLHRKHQGKGYHL